MLQDYPSFNYVRITWKSPNYLGKALSGVDGYPCGYLYRFLPNLMKLMDVVIYVGPMVIGTEKSHDVQVVLYEFYS